MKGSGLFPCLLIAVTLASLWRVGYCLRDLPRANAVVAGDAVPCELALASVCGSPLADFGSSPTPAPSPDDEIGQAIGDRPQGWIFSDAKALIAKGNALADRGKAILDAAERDGKITLDVKLPKPAARSQCPDGSCPLTLEFAVEPDPDAGGCPDGSCALSSRAGRRLRWRR